MSAELVTQAHQRTLAAGSARIELLSETTMEWPAMPPPRRRGGLLRPVGKLAAAGAGRAFARFTERAAHRSAEGAIDLRRRRYMLDHGAYAELHADGREWDGRSGRPLVTLTPEVKPMPVPLWLVDVLAGVTEATETAPATIRGAACRGFDATADLSRASAATPDGVAVPAVDRYERLLALPIAVWIDDAHVRRVRYRFAWGDATLELWDFGVDVEQFDWNRLPTFRTPED